MGMRKKDGLTIAACQKLIQNFGVSQYSPHVLLLPAMSVRKEKISNPILELVLLFYVAVRNVDKIKYYCHFTDEKIEE